MHKPLYYYLYTRSPIAKIAWGILSLIVMLVVTVGLALSENGRMNAQTANWDARSIEKGAALYAASCVECHGANGEGAKGPALHSRYFFSDEVEIDGEKIPAGRLHDVDYGSSLGNYVLLTIAAGRPSKESAHWPVVMATWGVDYGGSLRNDQVQALANYVLNWEESALAQTPEEDPWVFFQDSLSKQLPYTEDEPGYEDKVKGALTAAEFSGVAEYTFNGQEYTFEQNAVTRTPQQLWVGMACSGCHNINENQTDDNRGPVGPHQNNLYERAGDRVEGVSAEEYIYQSIVEPGAYIVEGYSNNMPANFSDQMSEEEIQGLVAWLLDPNREQ